MIATDSRSTETFELPLTLTGGLSAEEADRRVAVALRAGDAQLRRDGPCDARASHDRPRVPPGAALLDPGEGIKGTDLFTGCR